MNRKRAPNGYRITEWADGIYHVYFGASCIDEVLTRAEAMRIAHAHRAAYPKPCPICGRVDDNHMLDNKHSTPIAELGDRSE